MLTKLLGGKKEKPLHPVGREGMGMHVAPSLPMACIIHSLGELAEATCMCSKTDQLTVNYNSS